MTLKESLQIRNNKINILVTVSGIYSHSKTSKCMVMYNLPSSKGTITRTLTLQVPKNQQHDTSLQSVQPNHQDYGINAVKNTNVSPLNVPIHNRLLTIKAWDHYFPYESSRLSHTSAHKTFLQIIIPRDVPRQRVITIQTRAVCSAPTGFGSHTMGNGRKGQGNVTYLDGHIALLYQTCSRVIEPWGCKL